MLVGRAIAGRRDQALVRSSSARCGRRTALDRLRRATGRGEELPRVHARAARGRSHRRLPPRAPRSDGADRGHHRRDRRPGEGGLRPHIGLSEVGADTIRRAPRCTRSSICRSSTRWSAAARRRIFPALRRARHRGDGVRGAVARSAHRHQPYREPTSARTCRGSARTPNATGGSSRRSRSSRPRRQVTPGAARDRVGASRGARIVPTIGARTRVQLDDALGALAITLTPGS